ncbi:MAG: transglutaminase-like domain-containing protein [Sarcina sp.]
MKKVLIIGVIATILILGAMPFSTLFSKYGTKQNIIIAGDSWEEGNFGNVTAYSGNTKNTSEYKENISIIDGQPIKEVTVGNNAIKSKANQIVENATSDYQKAQDIYVWISENVKYDTSAYGTKDPAIYAFEHEKAVCTGFAGLYSAMCRDIGLSVRQIGGIGNGQEHTWNQVYVDNKWVNVDCTFASSLFKSAMQSEVTLTSQEAYKALTINEPTTIIRGYNSYTFEKSDYFNTSNFMNNRKAEYLIYEYNND